MKNYGSRGQRPRTQGRRPWTKWIIFGLIIVITATVFFSNTTSMAASGGESASKGWVATDTFRVLNFAVLVIGLFFILRKPLSQALRSRITGIKEQLENLEAQKQAAEKKLAEYNDKLSEIEAEAENIVSDYIKQGKEAKAKILKEAERAADKLQDQARRNIEYEFAKAKQQLQEEVLENSLAKAEGIIKQKITAEDQDRLVDEYLEKVVA
jgi:F-type H+-transporting ATPase subunit b